MALQPKTPKPLLPPDTSSVKDLATKEVLDNLVKLIEEVHGDVYSDISALSPMLVSSLVRGDLLYKNETELARLVVGAADTILKSDGTDPGYGTLTALLDTLFSSSRGSILYRGASAWLALAPGTAGHRLQTNGAGADPSWAAVTALESGTWSSPGNALDTIYQNTSGKKRRVLGAITFTANVTEQVRIGLGSSSPPTAIITDFGRPTSTGADAQLQMPFSFEVPNNWYYRVLILSGTPTLNQWNELDE